MFAVQRTHGHLKTTSDKCAQQTQVISRIALAELSGGAVHNHRQDDLQPPLFVLPLLRTDDATLWRTEAGSWTDGQLHTSDFFCRVFLERRPDIPTQPRKPRFKTKRRFFRYPPPPDGD